MNQIQVVGEDYLTCALGEKLVVELLPGWQMPLQSINTKGITKLVPSLPRYVQQAKHFRPVLCIADTDGQCVKELLSKWLPQAIPEKFALRLAVSEAESWLIADRNALAHFLEVSENKIPQSPDSIKNPKRELLNLARHSKKKLIRQDVVSQHDPNKQGTGYNQHLCAFVKTHWSAQRAATNSPSLARAISRVKILGMTVT